MKKPRMILFDYGQTLVNEEKFDGIRGTKALLEHTVSNRHGYTAEDIQVAANAINTELGRFDPAKRKLFQIEIPNHMFSSYLYQSMGIELSLTPHEIDRVFWDASSPGTPTDGIEEFLLFLKDNGIRTGIISNTSFCGEVVKEQVNSKLPQNEFEFVIATSEYMFRKPNRRIFELALEKAGLDPDDIWYIGDNYDCDVIGARNAGIFPVWYIGVADTHARSKNGVLTVTHWNELINILTECE